MVDAVSVQLRDDTDPDLGGQYTLKRWCVTEVLHGGAVEEIELCPDNQRTSRDGCERKTASFGR